MGLWKPEKQLIGHWMFDFSVIFFVFWLILHILFEPLIMVIKCVKWMFAPLPEVIGDKDYSKELKNLVCKEVEIKKGYAFVKGYLDWHIDHYRIVLGNYPNYYFLEFNSKNVVNVFRNHIELGS